MAVKTGQTTGSPRANGESRGAGNTRANGESRGPLGTILLMVAREGCETRRLEAMESDRGGTVIVMPLTELLLLRSTNFLLRASQWLPTQTVYNFFKRFQGEKHNNIYLIIF